MIFVAISALPLFIMLFYAYPMFLLCAFPVVELVDVFFGHAPQDVGGFDLVAKDPIIFFGVTYLIISVLRYPKKVMGVLKENIFLTVFLALVALYVVICTPVYGQSAIGEARKEYAFFLFPLLALLIIKKPQDLRRLVQVTILATAVVGIATLGLAVVHGSITKAIGADGAIMITLAAFAMLIHYVRRLIVFHPILDRALLVLFTALAITLGHRTVWLAIGFGLVLLFWLYLARPSLMVKCAIVLLMLSMVSGSALVYFPQVTTRLADGFAGIINPSSDNTASWRIEGWTQQLEELKDSRGLLFGNGLGGYYYWKFGNATITVAPHNAYVQLILKFGLIGLIIYVLLASHFFLRSLAVKKGLGPGEMRAYVEMGILSFGAFHAYMLGYDFHLNPLIYFAVAMSAADLSKRKNARFPASRMTKNIIGLQSISPAVAGYESHEVSID
jgi:O-antigen ligase